MITIVVADDHRRIRQAVSAMLGMESDLAVLGEASDGAEAVAKVQQLQPDVLVVDIVMPKLTGLEVIRELKQRQSRTRCVVLSMCSSEHYVREAVSLGAMGYVLKDACVSDLASAVRHAVEGKRYCRHCNDAASPQMIEVLA